MRVDVWELEFDDDNREKLHEHGLSPRVAFEVLDGVPRVLPNRGRGKAALMLIGPTSQGFVSLPIDETNTFGRWRPRTGYPSKPSEIRRYDQAGRRKR